MKFIYPNIYYLYAPMKYPNRCLDGLVLAMSINGKFKVKIDGEILNNQEIYIFNESSLYQVYADSVILFYFPSTTFTNHNINIFNKNFVINDFEENRHRLTTLFNYYKSHQSTTIKGQDALKELLFSITKNELLNEVFSSNLLKNLMNYISNNLHNRVTLENLSQEFYVSKSSISTLFKKELNISFYDYMTSLRVSKSIQDLIVSKKKIETIAHDWNYPSATNYIIHFKKITGFTPKKYRSLPAESKHLNIENTTNDYAVLNKISINISKDTEKTEISIRDEDINDTPFTYFNLIDIGNYENLDSIINEPIFSYKNFSNFKVSSYIYISEPMDELINESFEKIVARLRKLLKTKISLALKITNIKQYQFISKVIEELHFLESEHLPTSVIQNGSILLLLDLNQVPLSDIKNIHRNIYGTKILISIDITMHYEQNTLLSNDLIHLNPDFYTINFEKINKSNNSYNNKEHFNAIHSSLYNFLQKINARNNVIFLDYEAIYTSEFLNNISSFLKHSISSREYLAGASIHFTKFNNEEKSIAIFDEIENKTPFYFLGIMLLNFSKYPCYYGENYLVTKNPHSYNILLYNTDSTFTRNISEYTKEFHISFSRKLASPEMIISCELLNNNHGSLEGIVSNIEDLKSFPNSLKYKISHYNNPLLKVNEHNFNSSPYIVEVPPKSIVMITLYY